MLTLRETFVQWPVDPSFADALTHMLISSAYI